MDGPVTIDVITPTVRGRERMLTACKASVLAAELESPWAHVAHLVALDDQRSGPGRMRNQIVSRGEGDWLLLLDDDDEIDRDFLEVLRPHLDGADVVAGWYRIDGVPPAPGWCSNRLFRAEAILRGPNFLPVTAMIRRDAWKDVGGMRPVALEDHDLWIRMVKAEKRFVVVPEVIWTFRMHEGQHYTGRDE